MSDNKHEIDISKLTFEQLKKIRTYLKKLIDNGGSDLHVKANGIIRARINGNIVPFSGNVLTHADALTDRKSVV